MKNRERYFFSGIILWIHTIGAAGALTTTLKLEWGRVLMALPFLVGLTASCVLALWFWRPCTWKRLMIRGGGFLAVYSSALLLFHRGILNALAWGMSDAVERLNERYEIQIIWKGTPGGNGAGMPGQVTLSVLVILIPYVLLLGYGVLREHIVAVLLADAVWLSAAGGMDAFPDYIWLIICVMCIAAQMIFLAYRDNVRAGIGAVVLGLASLSGIMLAVCFFLLPVMDEKYEQVLEARVELNRKVNEEWIPQLQSAVSSMGFGRSADVTGSLRRQGGKILTFQDIYRISLSSSPRSAVYLRGFVGTEYAGDQWKAEEESGLENYYRRKGWERPESGRELVNMAYRALGGSVGLARVEELAGAGSYSLYPYGAELGEEYRVHWDGTADRSGRISEYSYRAPNGKRAGQISGKQAEEELRYREYAYDCFCDYPAERFPELTAFLDQSGFRRGSVYDKIAFVYAFLRAQAVYELGAADTPRGEDFIEYFLFESQQGYCAHFASAAVLMLRYLGVPARYVTGYSLSAGDFTKDENGMYTAVATDLQAHAWAEVYLDGIGWMPVEMTPGAAAFTEDASLKQLELAGRFSGAITRENQKPKIPAVTKSSGQHQEEEEPEEAADSEKETQPEKRQPGQEQNREQETSSPPAAGQTDKGGRESSENVWTDDLQTQDEGRTLGRIAVVTVSVILTTGCLVFLYLGVRSEIDRRRRKKFQESDRREKIFLLYRNLRRLLRLAGHEERLEAADQDTRIFRSILEKSGFAAKEPTVDEVRTAAVFCCGTLREEYEGLFFGKKPLFRWLNTCPWEDLKEMEIF